MSGTLTLDEMNATGNFISSVQGGSSPSSLGGEVSAISQASHYSKVTSRPRAYFQKEGRATTKDPILARPRHSQYSLHPKSHSCSFRILRSTKYYIGSQEVVVELL